MRSISGLKYHSRGVEDMPDVMLYRMEWTPDRNIPLRHVEIENGIQMFLFYSFDNLILSPRIKQSFLTKVYYFLDFNRFQSSNVEN